MNSMMRTAMIVGDSGLRVFGLTPKARLERQLGALDVIVLEPDAVLDPGAQVLLLRGGYLYDRRILAALLTGGPLALTHPADPLPAALVLPAGQVDDARQQLLAQDPEGLARDLPRDLPRRDAAALDGDFDPALHKTDAPWLAPLRPGDVKTLENRLFDDAYKGITDLVTKWCWPRPARAVVRWAADRGIRPNGVTLISLLLVIVAAWLFSRGQFAAGLVAAWLMTFLDTVDGKLARVTVSASRFGHYFDHLIDLLHPPVWYILWGMGLVVAGHSGVVAGLGFDTLYWWLVLAYVAGRVIEGAFSRLTGFSLFAWRPFDAWFRLVTARRNPCLVLLTLSLLQGRPDLGLLAVVVWTVFSTLVLGLRWFQAWRLRRRGGAITSWLADAGSVQTHARSYRRFSGTRIASS